jgi:hypothetical protein
VELLVEQIIVDVPDPPLIVAGLKTHVVPLGTPLTLRATAALKPPEGATLTVYDALPPAGTDCDAGVAARVKSFGVPEPQTPL